MPSSFEKWLEQSVIPRKSSIRALRLSYDSFPSFKKWCASDSKKHVQSGVAEEFSEEDKLMADVVESLDDIDEERTAGREAEKRKKEKQKRVDEVVLNVVSNCRDKRKLSSTPSESQKSSS